MKKLISLGVLALLMTGCGQGAWTPMGLSALGGLEASKAKKAASDLAAVERALAEAQERFVTHAQRGSGTRQNLLGDTASLQGMTEAMGEMADLHERVAALKSTGDDVAQAEAIAYQEAAAVERSALKDAGRGGRGAIGRLRDAFWEVVNKLATKPTQSYFKRPSKNPLADGDKLERFGDADIATITAKAQPGDVILMGNRDSFVHAAVYLGNGELVHALASGTPAGPDAQGVFRETFKGYFTRVERARVVILRVKGFSAADNDQTVAYAIKQVGKPYDNLFRTQDEAAFYCTELAYRAVSHGASRPAIGTRKKAMGLFDVVTTDDFRLSKDFVEIYSKNAPAVVPAQ